MHCQQRSFIGGLRVLKTPLRKFATRNKRACSFSPGPRAEIGTETQEAPFAFWVLWGLFLSPAIHPAFQFGTRPDSDSDSGGWLVRVDQTVACLHNYFIGPCADYFKIEFKF